MAPADYEQRRRARPLEQPGRGAANASGPDDHRPQPIEVTEMLSGDRDRRLAVAHRLARDAGGGAHPLGGLHRAAHHQVELGVDGPRLLGHSVGPFELGQYLGLPQHHAVEAARDPEGVVQPHLAGMAVDEIGITGPGRDVVEKASGGLLSLVIVPGGDVELGSVAGAEAHCSRQTGMAYQRS